MGKYKPYIIGGICLLLVILYITCGSCKDPDPYWEGQYSIISSQLEELRVKNEASILTHANEIKELNKEIGHATKRVGILESSVVTKDEDLLRLETQFSELGDDSFHKDAKIDNLTKQVSIWKEKFTLAEKIIAEKDTIIFSLKEQYENQLKISFDYKEMYESVQVVATSLQVGIKSANKQIVKLKVQNKIKNLACTALAGLVLYKMVQGK